MKASKEIAADYFIRNCKRNGVTHKRGIIQEARDNPDLNSREVDVVREALESGASNISGVDEIKECSECGRENLFDESEQEYYCPVCE